MHLKIQIPEKLEPIVTKKKRYKVMMGGRGAGKSESVGKVSAKDVLIHGLKVGCFREFQNSIDDSVYALLKSQIEKLGIPGYTILKTEILNQSGGMFKFKGLSRTPSAVQSMHGFKRFWIEEAQDISKDSLKILKPTLREEDAECWLTLNPMSVADAVSQRFIEPFKTELDRDGFYEDDLHYIVKINYYDNPWFPPGLDADRRFDFKNLPRAEYNHIWLGEYLDTVEGAIILPEWWDAAVDAHKTLGFKPLGKKVVAHDPSDEGADDKSLVVRHGSVITEADIMATGDSADGIDWAVEVAINENADLFVWDCDGLGVSLKREVKMALEGKGIDWAMYKGSETVDRPFEVYDGEHGTEHKQRTNKQTFFNRRSQFSWAIRDRLFNTYRAVVKGEYIPVEKLISISSECKHLQKFRAETCRIPKKRNRNGFIQIMPKDEMKRLLKIPSPNLFDSGSMSLFLGEDQIKAKPYQSYQQSGTWMG